MKERDLINILQSICLNNENDCKGCPGAMAYDTCLKDNIQEALKLKFNINTNQILKLIEILKQNNLIDKDDNIMLSNSRLIKKIKDLNIKL
jgi:hypothetical protein